MKTEQERLVGDGDDPAQATRVWVVVGNYADDPHPKVLGVYDNEDAAERHRKAITNSTSPSTPVAWGKHEMFIESEIGECPICGASGNTVTVEKPDPIADQERCRECGSAY